MKSKYDWSGVHPDVKWISTDDNYCSYGYFCEIEPYIILNSMFVGGNYIKLGSIGYKGNWKDSLEERPNESE